MSKDILIPKNNFFENKDLSKSFDALTGALNREEINDYASFLISENIPFSLSLIDIDNFKYINDTYGHLVGDIILKEVAKKIYEIIGSAGVFGRFGGDEFLVVYEGITDYQKVWSICHSLNTEMAKTFFHKDENLPITFTTGLSRFPIDAKDYQSLLDTTDLALYRGKMKGRNCFIIYLPEKHKNINLKTVKEKKFTSMFLHMQIFNHLCADKPLETNITNLFKYFCSYLMIDRICIETPTEKKFEVLHSLISSDNYKHLDLDNIYPCLNNNGMFYTNNLESLNQVGYSKIKDLLDEQNVKSIFFFDIKAFGKSYGILRAETVNKGRIWQFSEMDLLVTSAKVIAMILHYTNQTI